MSRTITSRYLATLFASAVVFHTGAAAALEKVAAQPDPAQELLELLKSAAEATGQDFPADSLAAINAKAELRPLRLQAARLLTTNLLNASKRDLAQAESDGDTEVLVVSDADEDTVFFGPAITESALAELEALHAVVEATKRAETLMAVAEAGLRSAAQFGDDYSPASGQSLVLQ